MRSALLLLLFCGAANAAPVQLHRARRTLVEKGPVAAVTAYQPLAGATPEPGLAAEYGYVLAAAGFTDLALAELDRAFQLGPTDDSVLYYGARVLDSLGLSEAARELARPAPDWLAGHEPPLGGATRDRELGPFREEFEAAQVLLLQQRFVSAADRFFRLTRKAPQEALAWSGYAIALEKLGAFKTAAAAVGRDLELSGKDDVSATREVLAAHKAELQARPPLSAPQRPRSVNEALQGRFVAFLGGSLMHSDAGSLFNLNGRLGKFFTDRFDAGVNLGVISGNDNSDYNGIAFGLSGRYSQPLETGLPLNATAGARLQYSPAPDDPFSVVASPGLSYYLNGGGSVDLVLDFGLSGPLKNSVTLSLGYGALFGGGR